MKSSKTKNLPIRILLILVILIPPIVFFRDFYKHFYVYLTGNIITRIITQQWHIVVLSILLFVAFLIPLSFRRKANWAERGLVTAFFISLFIEMYGIPLTILFASKYFLTANASPPSNFIEFNFLGVGFGMDMAMSYAALLMIIGALFVIIGWITLYRNVKRTGLVTNGIYRYSRHPQYLGFILVIIGWFIGWPTILTLIFTPILTYRYIRLCKTEEREIQNKYPEYENYKARVPFFV
jgi:protein-S-isoprenylcysteine O-methyltransferase Ste14